MRNNRVKILAFGILSVSLITIVGYSVSSSGGSQPQPTHFSAAQVPHFTEDLLSSNEGLVTAKRILFKAHFLSKLMGTASHSEFSQVVENWQKTLSSDANLLEKSDKNAATQILALMKSYEQMKLLRYMGKTEGKRFWQTASNLTHLVYDPNSIELSGDDYGFTSCSLKKLDSQSKSEEELSGDDYGFTSCSLKKLSNQPKSLQVASTLGSNLEQSSKDLQLSGDDYGFTSCAIKKLRDQPNSEKLIKANLIQKSNGRLFSGDDYGFTSCSLKKIRNGQIAFWQQAEKDLKEASVNEEEHLAGSAHDLAVNLLTSQQSTFKNSVNEIVTKPLIYTLQFETDRLRYKMTSED